MTKVCEICGKEFAVTNRNWRKKVCSLACRTKKHRMATIRSDIKTALKELRLEAHGNRIASHYANAKERHPYFCDAMAPMNWSAKDKRRIDLNLSLVRTRISGAIKREDLGWDDILDWEVWEILSAIARGDTASAVEECYDAIAILLRTIDVLEGRQKLGKPEEAK